MTDTRTPVAFVDDDRELLEANAQTLDLAGYEPRLFASADAALAALDAGFEGVVVSDLRMPGTNGLTLFRELKRRDPDLPVILVTGHGDIETAVSSLKEGVYDFIAKPYPGERLAVSLRRAVEKRRLVMENRRLRAAAETGAQDLPLLGETPAMERLRQTIRQIAGADVDVLVQGETGSGKEIVAALIHRLSSRRDREYVVLNCGALPEAVMESELFGHERGAFTGADRRRIGRIEHADGGTLFLDELESMPPALQVKLLRVLESREIAPLGINRTRAVDLRVVAAVKVDLSDPASRGDFREDLYYRLNVVTLRVPPLRERKDDIPLLFAHFLARAARRFRREPPDLTPALRDRLMRQDWPGNVRELAHVAERVALGIEPQGSAPEPLEADGSGLAERVARFEAGLLRDALARHRGDAQAAVEELKLPRKTFYDKLARHGLAPKDFR
ncbi:sigma-54-dependent transcriptional regulator [Aureimonas leprariae]|uniref:Sigma-54-dependent Fis family transcriptional regulator n=1 Tax=Plantimonas leprariae TaxID=2615207 RepID=A0A7V7TYA3_9HYPH|nr:sigma-54 dependent transcriptional regulator [Aureimonas leprariae]KAB0682772.1 sigma-54-dependent Fis family transcriptional regulator [Aureimonas leprariae]